MSPLHLTEAHYHLIKAAELTFQFATVAFALWRGDRPARAVALIYLAAELTIQLVDLALDGAQARQLYPLIDAPVLLLMVLAATRRPSAWLFWACAFRLAIVGTHIGYALDDRIRPLAYLTALNTWLMLAYAALLWGAIQAGRRRSTPMVEAQA